MSNQIDHRRRLVSAAGLAVAVTQFGFIGAARAQPQAAVAHLATEGELPSLDGAIAWLNSQPLAPATLRGKVVVINFCTYTCINWLRTLPYVRAWAGKYRNQGLVTIGVHTPEFGFEKDLANVRPALKKVDVDYPVAVDSNYVLWRAFNNDVWPALYFVDAQGKIRHHQFGEGDYEQSEKVIQQLLAMAGHGGADRALVAVTAAGTQLPADWDNLKSPENYVGYGRTERFASPGGIVQDLPHDYAAPASLKLNYWALAGNWTVGNQAVALNRAGGRITCRFHARDLHMVLGPPARGTTARFRVLIDGKPPGASHGLDVDAAGNGTVVEPRLYQVIRQPEPIMDRQFEIAFLDPGVEAFNFTFG